MRSSTLLSFIVAFTLFGCCKESTLFSRLSSSDTGIEFNNQLKEDNPEFSILNYPYFYNGGGVGIGDINNDGLPDICFTGNMVSNRLYLNEGNLNFKDISDQSTIGKIRGWSTGVTMVDINDDGWQDIFICRSGLPKPADRENLLYINNHDLTFTECAASYGLNNSGYSTQVSFFDYDRDDDLDMFLINQSDPKYARGYLDYLQTRSQKADSAFANKLFRNDHGHFTDISTQAGIESTVFTFSLGLSTADINQDGWPDIYVTNDFEEADYFYINNQDGTFSDQLAKAMDHTSLFSMGMDVADYNNDLLPDMVVLDMLPEDNRSQKMHIGGDNFTRYHYLFKNGMFPQYMKNTLQKNNGDGTFSEIGQLAGISNTDWSWSSLIADYDNDGLKDLFITNGYKRDNTDMQFMGYAMNESMRLQQGGKAANVQEYISHMPGIHHSNYVFKNEGNDQFSNKVKEWGLDQLTFSQGGAYADLDNDGDLDLVTNNTEDVAGIYRNNAENLVANDYIQIKLNGKSGNTNGIGAKIYAYAGKDRYYLENIPVRGYQSSNNTNLNIGLGKHQKIDSLRIIWPDQKSQLVTNKPTNLTVTLSYQDADTKTPVSSTPFTYLVESSIIDFEHIENDENDFAKQFLLPHAYSSSGPCLAKGDVNGDDRADFFVGGAKGQPGAIFLQTSDQKFTRQVATIFEIDKASEDMDAAFFDADGDNDLDLYVVSGGYEFTEGSPALRDRLYLNNGKGIFTKSVNSLPANLSNKKCVRPVDFDQDSDLDLFIGGHVVSGNFPYSTPSKIYFNDGKGNFSITQPANAALGIVNDGLWIDLNQDGKKDLIIASEWQPLKAFQTEGALFKDVSAQWFPFASSGWWNCIASADFDNDGDIDLVIGNLGLNTPLKADVQHPIELYYADVDGNGSTDPIIVHYIGNEPVPLPMRDDLISQLPMMKKKFNDYESFAQASIQTILTEEQLTTSPRLVTNNLETVYLENNGKTFVKKDLPKEAQYSSINNILVTDLNKDGFSDLLLTGNSAMNRIYLGKQDANHGIALLGDGKGNFQYLPQSKSGLNVRGDVRGCLQIDNELIFGINNKPIRSYKIQKPKLSDIEATPTNLK